MIIAEQFKLIFILYSVSIIYACRIKKFPKQNSFVCVCNEEYCDQLDVGPFSTQNAFTIYKSDLNYHRLTKTVIPDSLLNVTNDTDENTIHVSVNVTERLQSIIGFGGAFTDASGINMNKLKPAMRDRLMADYFGPDGAEYNLGRVPIAGSDFSNRPYSYDDVVNDFELNHFALAKDDFDYKIPYIKAAKSLSPSLKLFASPWAPPKWLKTNNKTDGLGILIGEPGSLHWKTWANYFVKFFDAYKLNGIEFWGLTPENEPLAGLFPNAAWNALGFSTEMMREFIKQDLGPALEVGGYGPDRLKVIIFDQNNDEVYLFSRGILRDKEAAKYVAGVGYHWYAGSEFYDNLDRVHQEYPDYFLLSTEACEGWFPGREDVGVTLGNWTRAETYAFDIIEGLNHWSTGWVDWNLVLDTKGSPNWANNFVDAPVIISDDGSEYYKQPMLYSLAHFSKFLRPGSRRVTHSIENGNTEGIKMTSFVNPSEELVMVVVNTNESPIKMVIKGIGEKQFIFDLGPRSIQTLIKPL